MARVVEHVDWMWIHQGGDRYTFTCERCNYRSDVLLPLGIDEFIDVMNGFMGRHRRCKRSLRGERLALLRALWRRANPAGGSFTLTLGV